jgi:hypothetical protein
MDKKNLLFIEKNHRLILWIILGLSLIVDIITTTIGLQKGGYEQTSFLISFVGSPILHLVIKIFIYGIIFVVIESIIFISNKIRILEIKKCSDENSLTIIDLTYKIIYGACIFTIILFICFTLIVQANNMTFILTHHSFL